MTLYVSRSTILLTSIHPPQASDFFYFAPIFYWSKEAFAISINGDRLLYPPLILCFATLWPGRAGEIFGISLVFYLIKITKFVRISMRKHRIWRG